MSDAISRGVRYKARLLLEGFEVPFVGVTITAAEGSIQFAQIDLVPHSSIKFIQPKTLVQVFVRDPLAFGNSDFYLAFEGEVVGKGYGKAQDGRTFSVMAADFSGYWDEAKSYFYNPNFILGKLAEIARGDVPPPATEAKSSGGKTVATSANTNSYMIKVIKSAPDIVTGVVNVLKTLGQVNLFYQNAYSRLRISERVGIKTGGKIKEFLSELNIEEFLNSYTGMEGGLKPLREMLNNVMAIVFHTFVSMPFPARIISKTSGEYVTRQFLFVPDAYPLAPPKCNVLFPNKIMSFNYKDDFKAAPTRFGFQASLPEFVAGIVNKERYQIVFYPKSFYNYMYNGGKDLGDEARGLLAPSSLFSSADYAKLKYGSKSFVKPSLNPVTKEQDFMTNEESIRGIFYEKEVFPPAITALMASSSSAARDSFIQSIGEYVFFKKRYAPRDGSVNLMFSPFLVPGLNGVILDDSDAGQSIIAKFQMITHSIRNDGAITTVQYGYGRDFDEVDSVSGGSGEPPLPKWLDSSLFGAKDKAAWDRETSTLLSHKFIDESQAAARALVTSPTVFTNLSSFYNELLGKEPNYGGGDSITDSTYPSSRGAVEALIASYRNKAAEGEVARDQFTFAYVRRPVQTMVGAMSFMGARPVGSFVNAVAADIPEEFAVFGSSGSGRFDGSSGSDANVVKIRRNVIKTYFEILKTKRGFRG